MTLYILILLGQAATMTITPMETKITSTIRPDPVAAAALLAPYAFKAVRQYDGPSVVTIDGRAGDGPYGRLRVNETPVNTPWYGSIVAGAGVYAPYVVAPYPTFGVLGTPVYGIPGYPYGAPGGVIPVWSVPHGRRR